MSEEFLFSGNHVYFIYFFIIFFSILQIYLRKPPTRAGVLEIIIVHLYGIGGFSGIVSFYMHTVEADRLAESIGWPAGNPFQTEVAVANLAIGIIGFLVFFRRDFMLPYVIAASIFGIGAGVTHIIDIMQHANFAPGNAGPILYADFIAPALRIGLYLAYQAALSPQKSPKNHAGWYGSRTPTPPSS